MRCLDEVENRVRLPWLVGQLQRACIGAIGAAYSFTSSSSIADIVLNRPDQNRNQSSRSTAWSATHASEPAETAAPSASCSNWTTFFTIKCRLRNHSRLRLRLHLLRLHLRLRLHLATEQVLPKADKRNYEAKPPVEHSPLQVPGSTRIAAIFSWLACGKQPSAGEYVGAALIISGLAAVTVGRLLQARASGVAHGPGAGSGVRMHATSLK